MVRPDVILILVSLACCFPSSSAAAAVGATPGIVRVIDGRTVEGAVTFVDEGLAVRAGDTVVRIGWDDVLSARLDRPAPAAVAAPRWTARDLGVAAPGGAAGGVRFSDDGTSLTARGAGNLGVTHDTPYFVYQQLAGDGTITARIASIARSDPRAKAGLMIRASVDPAAPAVAVFAHAEQRPYLMTRSRAGQAAQLSPGPDLAVPVHLKLSRRGRQFTAFTSTDGQRWDELSSVTVAAMPETVLAGFFVASGRADAMTTATIERPAIVAGAEDDVPATVPEGAVPPGLLLRNGSLLAGAVRSADEATVRLASPSLKGDGGRRTDLAVPAGDVAVILFRPLPRGEVEALRSRQPGLLLAAGDFVEGRFQGHDGRAVRLASVLFGVRRFQAAQAAAVLVRAPDARPSGRIEVRLVDGSRLMAERLRAEGDHLFAGLPGVGEVRIEATAVTAVRAGPGRYVPLGEADGGARAVLKAGQTRSYRVPDDARAVVVRAGVAAGVLPAAAVGMAVSVDGRTVHRAAPRTALDGMEEVALPVAGARRLDVAAVADERSPRELAPELVVEGAWAVR